MLYSSLRKKILSGWLKENNYKGFSTPLKLQKFLFFYEAFSKVENDEADFSKLRGYEKGPVFSDVYGDYKHDTTEFYQEAELSYVNSPDLVCENRAEVSSFLIKILNEEELSVMTHELNIWKSKEEEIEKGVKNVPLDENDLNHNDVEYLMSLKDLYSPDYIDSVEVIETFNKNFIINKGDLVKLTDQHRNVFLELSNNEDLDNPVYVTISEDGVLLID